MASAEARLKKQVSDRLVALIGCPVDMVVQMVVRIARDSASAADLAARLVGLVGFPSSADTVAFAKDVYGMFPCKGAAAGVSEYQRQVQSTLKLLDGNDDEDNASAATAPSSSGNNNRKKRFGRKGEEGDSDDDEATAIQDSERHAPAWSTGPAEDAGSDFGGEELELDREMVQLDRQIMEHGAKKTRKEEDRLARRSSRCRFLQKHKSKKAKKKAVALQNKILEYENIFYSIKVTNDEVREHRLNKKIYYLVRSAGICASEENAPGYSGGTTATP
jgi:pre-mRNA-splicing factor ATP-dependent RNA helicase DHX16